MCIGGTGKSLNSIPLCCEPYIPKPHKFVLIVIVPPKRLRYLTASLYGIFLSKNSSTSLMYGSSNRAASILQINLGFAQHKILPNSLR